MPVCLKWYFVNIIPFPTKKNSGTQYSTDILYCLLSFDCWMKLLKRALSTFIIHFISRSLKHCSECVISRSVYLRVNRFRRVVHSSLSNFNTSRYNQNSGMIGVNLSSNNILVTFSVTFYKYICSTWQFN